ncbi:MAG: YHYH domain-containing protein [Oscillospiraceae bacterium]|nr:YHYH domain-containing protein [Oscillospiraceae bacterium]
MRLKRSARSVFSLAMALAVISSVSASAFAHPGRTDSSGGHYNRSTGEYHYHNGGSSSGSSSRSTSTNTGSSSSSRSGSSSSSSANSASSRKAKWDGDKYWNGSKYVTGFCTIDGKKYCFDSSGKLYKNEWVTNSSGERFYIGSDGTVCTGWHHVDGHKYHLCDDGSMSTGWCKVDGKSYFLGNDGIARTGFRSIDGKVYCFDKNGAMCTGWQKIDGSTYYFKSSGERVSGKVKIDGKVYTFDENGRLQNAASTAAAAGQTSALKWGMTMDEVIEARQLDKYVIDEDVIITTDKVISDCYFFYEDSLCGYGKWTLYSKSSLKSFKKTLEDDGWENAGSSYEDGVSYIYYTKDGHITVIFYDDASLFRVRYADDFMDM